jgi:hypothetical protein
MQSSTASYRALSILAAAVVVAAGCAEPLEESGEPLPFAGEVAKTSFGQGAGHGQEALPRVVLGPPAGATSSGPASGADEVLSLGAGGEVVMSFGDRRIVDGSGADFVVFENPFWVKGDPSEVWAELAEVSVSQDGEVWHPFSCDTEPAEPGRWPGCAGWTPTQKFNPDEAVPLDPEVTGGDAFDLAEVGLQWARFVRIRDLSEEPNSGLDNAGFDLDAVGVVHWE